MVNSKSEMFWGVFMKNGKWIWGFLGTLLVFYAVAESDRPASKDIYDNLDLFANGLALIQRDYVDEVEPQKLIYGALKGMMGSLDPHSQFLNPESYREIQVETEGQFGGLGIEITLQENFLTVVSAIEGTPAFAAGILPKDRILKIDDKSTKDMTLEEAVKKLRGKPGSKVKLTILRSENKEILDFTLERAVIKIESITESQILEAQIGYVRMSEFQERSAEDLAKSIRNLEKKGLDGLILDLRNNPGGLLQSAVEVTNRFVAKGSLIVYTKGRKPTQNMSFKAKADPITNIPLIVLVNGGSASASEIVAGAVQDLKRGIIVGEKTFGKGSVQSVIPLKDGSALKLTTAKYFTPNGRSIQGKGMTPDIVVDLTAEEKLTLKKGWRKNRDQDDEKPFPKDRQLQTAIDLLKGMKIFEKVSGTKIEEVLREKVEAGKN